MKFDQRVQRVQRDAAGIGSYDSMGLSYDLVRIKIEAEGVSMKRDGSESKKEIADSD